MFNLIWIKIHNFIKYEDQELDLYNQGFVLLKGDNRDEPKKASNGSGKSTLGDAIHWCLSGRTTRNILSDGVIGPFGKSCDVHMKIILDGKPIEVIRYRKDKKYGNSLRIISGTSDISHRNIDETQGRIEKSILGCSFNLFRISQFYNSDPKYHFSKMSSQSRAKIFDEIIGTDEAKVQDRIKIINKLIEEADKYRIKLNEREHDADTNNQNLYAQVGSLSDILKNGNISMLNGIKSIQLEIERLEMGTSRDCAPELIKIQKEYKDYLSAKQQIEDLKNGEMKELNDRINKVNYDIDILKSKITKTQNINYVKEGRCDKCGARVTKDSLQIFIDENNKEIERYSNEISKLLINNDVSELNKLKAKINSFKNQDTYYIGKIKTLELDIERVKENKELLVSKRKRLIEAQAENDKYIKDIQDKIKAGELKIIENNNILKQVVIEMRLVEDRLYKLQTLKEFYGPVGYLPLVMKSYSPLLADLCNHYLSELTGGSERVRISSNTQLASGEVRNKIDITVVQNNVEKNFPEEYSSGESSAIDICLNLALMKLANEKAKKIFSFYFFDEIVDTLSEKLVEQFFTVFKKMITPDMTAIFTAHRVINESYFDKIWTVRKENNRCQLM